MKTQNKLQQTIQQHITTQQTHKTIDNTIPPNTKTTPKTQNKLKQTQTTLHKLANQQHQTKTQHQNQQLTPQQQKTVNQYFNQCKTILHKHIKDTLHLAIINHELESKPAMIIYNRFCDAINRTCENITPTPTPAWRTTTNNQTKQLVNT